MSNYTPDVWVVLEFSAPQLENPTRKVFGGWYGGFAGSDSWKLNSGITEIRCDDEGWYEFDGHSGSTYYCHVNDYKMSGLMQGILSSWQKQAKDQNITIKILSLDEVAEL